MIVCWWNYTIVIPQDSPIIVITNTESNRELKVENKQKLLLTDLICSAFVNVYKLMQFEDSLLYLLCTTDSILNNPAHSPNYINIKKKKEEKKKEEKKKERKKKTRKEEKEKQTTAHEHEHTHTHTYTLTYVFCYISPSFV